MNGHMYYDRGGEPIDIPTWGRLHRDMDYRRVDETTLDDGTWVSTVWLGIDHSFTDDGPPIIFETMVFASGHSRADEDMRRYATEAEAVAGHAELVEQWRALSQARNIADGVDVDA